MKGWGGRIASHGQHHDQSMTVKRIELNDLGVRKKTFSSKTMEYLDEYYFVV